MGVAVIFACVLTASCAPAGLSRSGAADSNAVAARIGTPDPDGRPSAVIARDFADRLMRTGILATPAVAATSTSVSDEDILHRVMDGTIELAVVPARAFDLVGVTSLIPLQLPALVTTRAAGAAVAEDEEVTELLFAGLEGSGVAGLTLVPEELRRLFVMSGNDDFSFSGATVRTRPSKASAEVFATLGATPSYVDGPELDAAVAGGEIDAFETSWSFVPTFSRSLTVIDNAVFGVKFDVIAVNRRWFDAHDEDARLRIRAAAREAARAYVGGTADEAVRAADFCRAGGAIAHGPPALAAALADARDELAARWRIESTATATSIVRLWRFASPPDGLSPCSPERIPRKSLPAGNQTRFPEGVYRMSVTAVELSAAGMNQADAAEHSGTWTLTFRSGSLDMGDGCTGEYRVEQGLVELHLGGAGACGAARYRMLLAARWTVSGGTLKLIDVVSGEGTGDADAFIQALFQDRPFTKIG